MVAFSLQFGDDEKENPVTQTPSDYIRSHGLLRKYGWGLAIIALAGLASTLNGDPASILTLKMMIAVPFAIAVAWLPTIFDPARSRLPFTPSFVERSFLEGLLLALGVNIASWTPDYTPLRMVVTVTITTLIYFGLQSLAYSVIERSRRK